MRLSLRSLAIPVCLALSGLPARAHAQLAATPDSAQVARCDSACETEWGRARAWLVRHSLLSLRIEDDSLLQTATPKHKYPIYSFSVSRQPASDGRLAIQFALECGNRLGCRPAPEKVRQAFLTFVRTGTDDLGRQGRLAAIRD